MKRFIICMAAALCFASLYAQQSSETEQLTVDQAVKMALENNVTVKTSALSLELKKKQKATSWNSVSPTASVSGEYKNDLEKKTTTTSVSGSVKIGLSTNLYTSIRSAVLSYEAGELSYEQTLKNIELSVRKSFCHLLYEKENIAAQERSLATAKQTYESNLSKYNKGQLSELDLLNSKYNLDSKTPALESLKNTYQNDLSSFKQIIGSDLNKNIELTGTLDDAVNVEISEDYLYYDLAQVPAVKTAQNAVDASKNTLLASRFSAYGPSVTASYSYGKSKTGSADWAVSNSLTLGVSIPLDGYLPWSTGAMSVTSQKEALEEKKLSLEDTKTSTAISIRNSYNTIQQQQSQLETLRQNVTLMQRTYDMTQIAYNNGSRDLLTLQTAADNLLTAKTNLMSGEYNLICSVLELENTLGVPFGTFQKDSDKTTTVNTALKADAKLSDTTASAAM